jgi:hypothetical protein
VCCSLWDEPCCTSAETCTLLAAAKLVVAGGSLIGEAAAAAAVVVAVDRSLCAAVAVGAGCLVVMVLSLPPPATPCPLSTTERPAACVTPSARNGGGASAFPTDGFLLPSPKPSPFLLPSAPPPPLPSPPPLPPFKPCACFWSSCKATAPFSAPPVPTGPLVLCLGPVPATLVVAAPLLRPLPPPKAALPGADL